MSTELPRHERLSEALCEAVEFGHPTSISMGEADLEALLHSLHPDGLHKMDISNLQFEGVHIEVSHALRGCYVEHDNRYTGLHFIGDEGPATAVPDTVVMMNDSRKPAITAWESPS